MKDPAKMSEKELRHEVMDRRDRPKPETYYSLIWWAAFLLGSLCGMGIALLVIPRIWPI